jgi:hypothetical protein
MQGVDIKLSARSFCFLPGYVLPPQGDPSFLKCSSHGHADCLFSIEELHMSGMLSRLRSSHRITR